MFSIRLLAAAVLATGGLNFATAAGAASKNGAAPWSHEIVQVQHHGGGREEWRRRDGGRDGRREEYRDRDRDRDRDWDRDRDRRRDGHRESRRDDRHDRRDDWRRDNRRGYHHHDNGRHRGWTKHGHWRAQHHPRHSYWVGRRLPRNNYVVIYNYDDYYLPPPRRGHYYARIDNDVFLVAAATRNIIGAFLLLDALGR